VYLDFGKPVPDMTPDELKHFLSEILDFSKQTFRGRAMGGDMPPDIQNAIKDKRPAVAWIAKWSSRRSGVLIERSARKHPTEEEIEDWNLLASRPRRPSL